MLDRYKKKGGFLQLVQLLENAPKAKREQYLKLIANENPAWESALRKKLLSIEIIYSWEPQYLAEIFSRLPPLTLASALSGNTIEKNESLLGCLQPFSRRKITNLMAETNNSPDTINACNIKIIFEVRNYIAQGLIKLEKIDPDLIIPENIEDTISISNMFSSFNKKDMEPKSELQSNLNTNSRLSAPQRSEDSSTTSSTYELKRDLDYYKYKSEIYAEEIKNLQEENQILKGKLAQIRKIA